MQMIERSFFKIHLKNNSPLKTDGQLHIQINIYWTNDKVTLRANKKKVCLVVQNENLPHLFSSFPPEPKTHLNPPTMSFDDSNVGQRVS